MGTAASSPSDAGGTPRRGRRGRGGQAVTPAAAARARRKSVSAEALYGTATKKAIPSVAAGAASSADAAANAAAPAADAAAPRVEPKTAEALAAIHASMDKCFLFAGMDAAARARVVDAMQRREVTAGEVVIREGDPGDNFYVVERGTFVATKAAAVQKQPADDPPSPPTVVATYAHSGAFGELALLHGTPRAATVTATTPGTLWVVARPAFAATLHAAAAARRAAVAAALDGAPLLAGLDPDARAAVADCVTPVDVAEGDAVVRQGDSLSTDGGRMYIVAAGALECVRVLPDGVTQTSTRVEAGGWFGEVGLLGGGGATRAATVRAVGGPARLLALSRDAFERVAGPAAKLLADRVAEYGVLEREAVAAAAGRAAEKSEEVLPAAAAEAAATEQPAAPAAVEDAAPPAPESVEAAAPPAAVEAAGAQQPADAAPPAAAAPRPKSASPSRSPTRGSASSAATGRGGGRAAAGGRGRPGRAV